MEAKEEEPIPSFSKAPCVHPLIIKDYVRWVSDREVIVLVQRFALPLAKAK